MEEIQPLNYHEKALLASLRIARRSGNSGYEFYYLGSDLILRPWHNLQGRRIYLQEIRVTCDDIVSRDEELISELEGEIRKI